MPKKSEKTVESITIDFIKKSIVFKMTDGLAGRTIENIHKILNLDERFRAINTRLALHHTNDAAHENMKLSTILRGTMLTDINTEKSEITFHFHDVFELFDVERTGE